MNYRDEYINRFRGEPLDNLNDDNGDLVTNRDLYIESFLNLDGTPKDAASKTKLDTMFGAFETEKTANKLVRKKVAKKQRKSEEREKRGVTVHQRLKAIEQKLLGDDTLFNQLQTKLNQIDIDIT